jgi:hypothetical protein
MPKQHEFFGPDDESYNIHTSEDAFGFAGEDGSGRPGIAIVANALQFWVGQRKCDVATVGRAAEAFNMPPEAVREAVEWSQWMLLVGADDVPLKEMRIELDGE